MANVIDETVSIDIDVLQPKLLLYYKTSPDLDEGACPSGPNLRAQTFIANGYVIKNIRLIAWRKEGSTPGIVTVSIRDVDVDGHPLVDEIIASGSFDANMLPEGTGAEPGSNAEWIDVPISPEFYLNPGTRFGFVLDAPDAAFMDIQFVYDQDTFVDYENLGGHICQYLRYEGGEWTVGYPTGNSVTMFFEFIGIGQPSCIHWTQDPLLRLDVNQDGYITWEDAAEIWQNRDTEVPYNPHYDVNCDGVINFQDAGVCWLHIEPWTCGQITDEDICTLFAECYWYGGACHSEPLAYEDFMSYEIFDSDNFCASYGTPPPYLNVTSTNIQVNAMQARPVTYVRKTTPSIGDFDIWFNFSLGTIEVGSDIGFMHFCNDETTVTRADVSNNADGIGLNLRQNVPQPEQTMLDARFIVLKDYETGVADSYPGDLLDGESYVVHFYRQGINVTADFYDSEGQNILLTRTITGANTTTYNYILPVMSKGEGGCANSVTAELSNLVIE